MLSISLCVAGFATSASAFDCPPLAAVERHLLVAATALAIPPGDDLVVRDQLKSAVFVLRQEGIPDDQMVNSLFAAYCPRIAEDPGLTDSEKDDRAQHFLEMANAVVYETD
jgi:hypothetical protein